MHLRLLAPAALICAVAPLAACGQVTSPGSATATATVAEEASTGTAGRAAPTGEPTPHPPAGERPDVPQLVRQMKQRALDATSVHLTGTLTQDRARVSLDMAGRVDGTNQKAVIARAGQGTTEILTVGRRTYVKSDAAALTAQSGGRAARMLAGKYVVPPASTSTDATKLTLSGIISTLFTGTSTTSGIDTFTEMTTTVSETTEQGTPAWTLTKDGASVVVAADGSARLLHVTGPATQPSRITFRDWDSVSLFTAPPPSSVIDLGR